jgi:uncharacterized protein (DUF1501 family)
VLQSLPRSFASQTLAPQFRIFVIALVHFENEVGAAKNVHPLLLVHMVRGVRVEVTGTEHVATARFDVAGGHIKIGFGITYTK